MRLDRPALWHRVGKCGLVSKNADRVIALFRERRKRGARLPVQGVNVKALLLDPADKRPIHHRRLAAIDNLSSIQCFACAVFSRHTVALVIIRRHQAHHDGEADNGMVGDRFW